MYKHIHFVGIKGVGMTALAVLIKEAGIQVTGSDIGEQFITDMTLHSAGITPLVGFESIHVNEADLVITTGAHGGFDNPEVVSAKEKGIRVISLAEAIGMVMNGELLGRKLQGISVAGTHGKTTTSALIATIMKHNDFDPSYFIGTSYIPALGNSGHYGSGDFFVVESDEYATEPIHDKRPKFLWQHPHIAVFTNIELDHPDIYPDVDSVRSVFLEFANQIESGGVLIADGDDPEIQKLLQDYSGRLITYGFDESNDFIVSNQHVVGGTTVFDASIFGTPLGAVTIHIHGDHNILNAAAAIVAGLESSIPMDKIKAALLKFTGTVRRLEYKGALASGAILYDDYAHHPTEVNKTLAAVRGMYPDKQIICVFQPHTYSRTKALFDDFTRCFSTADEVVILDIYSSAREEKDLSISSELLVNELKKTHNNAIFLPTLSDVVKYLNNRQIGGDTVIITMGAGNIYRIEELLDK
jgi:UDP-N-acetylmuramate--alanine ligase